VTFKGGKYQMGKYILRANDVLVDGEACICSQKLVADNVSRGDDPFSVPVGVAEVLKLVPRM
jgi:hypothetical protein